jgi:hypothetical protein
MVTSIVNNQLHNFLLQVKEQKQQELNQQFKNLKLLAEDTIQNKVYDPGISSHVSHSALSLYFKLWNPGGHLFNPSP